MHESEFKIDVGAVAGLWNHGSVVRSWLLELAARALHSDGDLSELQAYVEDSGEGRWTLEEAIDLSVPVPAGALTTRIKLRSVATCNEELNVLATSNLMVVYAPTGVPTSSRCPMRVRETPTDGACK